MNNELKCPECLEPHCIHCECLDCTTVEEQTPDEKVLDYLERSTKILSKFAPKIRTEWGLEVERTTNIIEIAKLLQRETNK